MRPGIYGEPLPNQNGAPIRLVDAVEVRLQVESRRLSASRWSPIMPQDDVEHDGRPTNTGSTANVNPEVDHPRWSQATERRVGGGLFAGRQDTLKFNGYGDQVAALYAGQDLAKDY